MTDVIVAGGGPVGLLLASELKLAGADPLVLESAPDGAARRARSLGLRGVNGRTTQSLAMRDLLGPLAEAQEAVFAAMGELPGGRDAPEVLLRLVREGRARGHFGGLPLLKEAGEGGGATPNYLMKQHALEQILADRARELGVRIEHGWTVADVVDDGESVTVVADDGRTERAAYLVGCDGGRSVVRRKTGIEFPGTDATMTGRTVVAELADPDSLTSSVRAPGGLVNLSMVRGEIATIEFDGGPADRDALFTAEELIGSLRRVTGRDIAVKRVEAGIRYSDNTRQAATYRKGRVLLAGDAAHVHSPIGGQGLNLGMQDAMNLGWKLGLVVRGIAPESLLDTYHAERHPVGARVLRNTRAQVALMRPGPQIEALREVMSETLAIPVVRDKFIAMVNGVDIDYAPDAHPRVGRFLPGPVPEVRDGKALLLSDDDEILATARGFDDRVRVTGAHPDVAGLLVRPDGYVAWATSEAGTDGLAEALSTWFGAPAAVPVAG
ncbi:FAD-dependent monooxygenase [Amycolatopsis sp. NPDC059027]|uniref:FAD-dependent monooxygenase n=1 Tax=Amycolatopsis sp. NPDC059027 TaxID=3346709 RepID=UPI00366E95A1